MPTGGLVGVHRRRNPPPRQVVNRQDNPAVFGNRIREVHGVPRRAGIGRVEGQRVSFSGNGDRLCGAEARDLAVGLDDLQQ